MLRVALTGGLGSGKSTAAAMFRNLGCFVTQSDEVAREMMQPGQAVYKSIVQSFGGSVLASDGALDRAVLARIAFREGRAEELNCIVHPAVIAFQSRWMDEVAEQHPGAVAMVESALIFETKHGGATAEQGSWRTRFDRIVLVTAPEQVRIDRYIARYIARAGASTSQALAAAEADARARLQMQTTDNYKAALSDVVIQNAGTPEELRQEVTQVCQQLQAEAAARARERSEGESQDKRNAPRAHPY